MAEKRLFEEATRVLDTDYASTTETITLSRVPDYILLGVVCPQSDFPYTMTDSMMVNGEFAYPPEHNGFDLGIRVNGNTVTISYFDRNAKYEPTVTIKAYIGQVMVDDATLFNIANAIREINGTEDKYSPSEMADAIYAIGNSAVNLSDVGFDETANYLVSNRSGLTTYSFPEGTTKIEGYAFSNCSNLVLTELPATLTTIGQNAFASCTKLAISELPEGLTEVNTSAFSSCKGITTMTLPSGIQYVWSSAFSFCTNLTSVTFKGTPEEIADNAFNYCTNLKTINVPWASGAVAGAPWGATKATINYNYTG